MRRPRAILILGSIALVGIALFAIDSRLDLFENFLAAEPGSPAASTPPKLEMPMKEKSVRFALIGDNGTGESPQYEVANLMKATHDQYPFEFVLMLGDNIYGSKSKSSFQKKFEDPYRALLDGGVKFYASLGNHDDPNEIFYKPFNMEGKRYYSLKRGNAEFFALDSTYMDPAQLEWLATALKKSSAEWKICFYHHPIYSDGKFHGPDLDLRARLEPVMTANGVRVVFNGHEHLYERLTPQNKIDYFILGNSGQLRRGNIKPSAMMAKGLDTDQAFMIAEISGKELFFQTIARAGQTVDSGVLSLTQ